MRVSRERVRGLEEDGRRIGGREMAELGQGESDDMRTMHLFAGAGGGLLADLILGHQPVVAVEWDAYACAVLRERFPFLLVFEGDVRMFDPSCFIGLVDCIHAGFPCQDISVAGKGAGIGGARSGLFSEVLRAVDAVRPPLVFLENSPQIVTRGLDHVLRSLAERGYDAVWTILAAADVGAPHLRKRWWCLAWRSDSDRSRFPVERWQGTEHRERWEEPCGDEFDRLCEMSDPSGNRRQPRWSGDAPEVQEWRKSNRGGEQGDVRNTNSAGLAEWQGKSGNDGKEQSSAVGAGWWDIEPDLGRVADGVASHVDRLKALGNGQVPLCAAIAFRMLWDAMMEAA